MEPWTVFKWIRRVVFVFVVIIGIIWASLLSFYLSRVWSVAGMFQRAIILTMICVNGFSSLLLYLMVVVVFRMRLELLRMVFLLTLHITPAVFFTLYRSRFSCAAPFDARTTCDVVHLVIFCVAWSISGILVVYTIYLCIMSCVPRPFPLLLPDEPLKGSTSSFGLSRTLSMSSIRSGTRLLSQPPIQPYSLPAARPRSPSPPMYSQDPAPSRTIPKKSFVTNPGPASVAGDALSRVRREQQGRPGASYGAMGSPAQPRAMDISSIPRGPLIFSRSPVATQPAGTFPSAMFNRRPSVPTTVTPQRLEEGNGPRAPPRSPLLGANPFRDVPSRNPSPESFYSQRSQGSGPVNINLGGSYYPFTRTYDNYFTQSPLNASDGNRVGIPPQLQPGPLRRKLSEPAVPYAASSQSSSFSQSRTSPGTAQVLKPSSASVHSVAPSVHLVQPYTPRVPREPLPGVPPRAYVPNPPNVPRPTYAPAEGNGRLERPNSAGARMSRVPGEMLYSQVELPNPYGADIRRYGTTPRVRSGSYSGGYGPTAGYGGYAGATGYAGQAQGAPMYVGWTGRGVGVGAANGPSWREMVMRAATS